MRIRRMHPDRGGAAADDAARDDKGRGVLRFYELAKKQEWQVRDLPGEVLLIPETRAGASPERRNGAAQSGGP